MSRGKRFKEILWFVFHFSGFRFIWEKINPPTNRLKVRDDHRAPATFLLWVVGVYVAVFGVASQRYENRVDIIENRANAVLTLLQKNETRKNVIRNVPRVQRMECPQEPNILNPIVTIKSLFGESKTHQETIDILRATIEDFKSELSGTNLKGAILERADFGGAVLQGANLWGANLQGANLKEADLKEADLWEADLWAANLQGADLGGADLRGAENLTITQLSKVYTLYEAELDSELMQQIKKKYPHLLEEPKE